MAKGHIQSVVSGKQGLVSQSIADIWKCWLYATQFNYEMIARILLMTFFKCDTEIQSIPVL